MDISTLKPVETFDYEFVHPVTNEPLGIVWTFQSPNSDAVKAVIRQNADRLLAKRNKKLTTRELEMNQITQLAATVTGWNWNGNAFDGVEDPPFEQKTVIKILDTVDPMFDQASEVVDNLANFYKN